MSKPLPDWALRGATREMEWLAKRESLAIATGWAIRSERMGRQLLGGPLSVFGLRKGSADRRRREQSDRARLRGPVIVRAGTAARPPVVNWHERGKGPPLLLLSGWTASGLAWPSA